MKGSYVCTTNTGTRRTNAPIMPFDSCAGITCSGHGVCRDLNGKGLCYCDHGWFRKDCDDTPLRMKVVSNVSECGTGLIQAPPGVQHFACEGALNATGFTQVEVSILASPDSDVGCIVESMTPSEAVVLESSGQFRLGESVGTVSSHTIAGVTDLSKDANTPFTIRAQCQSSDRRFDGAAAEASAYTTDVGFPRISAMNPMLTAFTGQLVKIRGEHLSRNHSARVEVAGVEVSGPPIMRSVLLNKSAEILWEVLCPFHALVVAPVYPRGQLVFPVTELFSSCMMSLQVTFVNEKEIIEWENAASDAYTSAEDRASLPRGARQTRRSVKAAGAVKATSGSAAGTRSQLPQSGTGPSIDQQSWSVSAPTL